MKLLIFLLFSTAAWSQVDPSKVDLSDTPESQIIQMKAHAAMLRGHGEDELVKSLTDLSTAQSRGVQQEAHITDLDAQVAAMKTYVTAVEQARDMAEHQAFEEKKRADKLEASNARWRTFGHAVLAAVFAVAFGLAWNLTGKLMIVHFPNPYVLAGRIAACLAVASGVSYGLFYVLTRLL